MKVPKSCRHKARNKPYVRIDGKQKYLAVTFDENGADPHFMQKTQQRLRQRCAVAIRRTRVLL